MNYRIYLLALVAFMSGFDENVMIGLLSPVANELQVSIAAAGQLTTIFSIVFGLSAPVLVVICARWERRRLLVLALSVYFIANLLAGIAPDYSVLFIARILQATSCALICMLATTMATRLVPEKMRGRALGTVVMGISASLVLGIPAGIWIGSWRLSFIVVAVIALLLMAATRLSIPKLAPTGALPLRAYGRYARRPTLLFAQLATLIAMASYFAFFGYLTPYLEQRFHLAGDQIATSYMLLGLGGIAGSYFGGWLADKAGALRAFILLPALFFLAALASAFAEDNLFLLGVSLLVWTLTVWGMGPVVQNYLILREPGRIDVSIGFNISAIQLGIGLGTAVGGLSISHFGLFQAPWTGVVLAVITLLCIGLSLFLGRSCEPVASEPLKGL